MKLLNGSESTLELVRIDQSMVPPIIVGGALFSSDRRRNWGWGWGGCNDDDNHVLWWCNTDFSIPLLDSSARKLACYSRKTLKCKYKRKSAQKRGEMNEKEGLFPLPLGYSCWFWPSFGRNWAKMCLGLSKFCFRVWNFWSGKMDKQRHLLQSKEKRSGGRAKFIIVYQFSLIFLHSWPLEATRWRNLRHQTMPNLPSFGYSFYVSNGEMIA